MYVADYLTGPCKALSKENQNGELLANCAWQKLADLATRPGWNETVQAEMMGNAAHDKMHVADFVFVFCPQ
jgi:hypothetical protein